jgi:hypothetical protein
MTLYRATKQEFLEDIDNGKDVTGFVSLMKDFYLSESGKEAGVKEIKSWYTSLPAMARVLQLSHIPADTQVYIEYEIPRAGKVSKRHIDFMLAGKDSEGDDAGVVVVELQKPGSGATPAGKNLPARTTSLPAAARTKPSSIAWKRSRNPGPCCRFKKTKEKDGVRLICTQNVGQF